MNKKNRRREQILLHGFKLQNLFGIKDIGPVALAKSVHRLEVKAHRIAEDYCNGVIDNEFEQDRQEHRIMKFLDQLLGYKSKGIPIIFNGDPRGYALKIDDAYVREHRLDIHRDWGGYGILAPEFDGNL